MGNRAGQKFSSLAVIILMITAGCAAFKARFSSITADRPVRLVLDSPEVRQLIARQEAFQPRERAEIDHFKKDRDRERTDDAAGPLRESLQHPERYIPERTAFLDAMAQAPGVIVPGKSYCRILARSEAMCSRQPYYNPTYLKVRITSGPSKGQEGWACLGDDIRLGGVPL